jgi:hypothetical protein
MNLTDGALVHLAGIDYLDVSNIAAMTGSTFKYIQGVRSLDAANTSICDSSLAHLTGTRIEYLNVSYTNITDASVDMMKNVKELVTSGCKLSMAVRQQLSSR